MQNNVIRKHKVTYLKKKHKVKFFFHRKHKVNLTYFGHSL